ncbi:MAG TPA: TIGR03118 family protein [Bryobacteraceae bacterium]|nr:TIGR03118 family protein [Bryobacteraceae bacterium]
MKIVYRALIVSLMCAAAHAQDTATNSYTLTSLVSDIPGHATFTDSHLVNPWGLSRGASTYWWVSDTGTGFSTLYNAAGTPQTLVVTVPPASGTGAGTPTGTVAVGSAFIFVTLDGTISQWTSGSKAVIKVNNSTKGAVYTGCTTAKNGSTQLIYVANSAGGVEAYTTAFAPVNLPAGAFTDPNVPAGYTPYGIQAAGSKIYVTFSAAPGAGGYVDAFSTNGTLLLSLAQGQFNEPWGIAAAPAGFGKFAQALLVGNVGSGRIGAYNPSSGKFLGYLQNSSAQPITISGLWAIYFGAGNSNSGPTTTLYFAAGIDNYLHGLFGTLTAN